MGSHTLDGLDHRNLDCNVRIQCAYPMMAMAVPPAKRWYKEIPPAAGIAMNHTLSSKSMTWRITVPCTNNLESFDLGS